MKKMEVLWEKMEVLVEGEVDKIMKMHVIRGKIEMRGKTEKFLKTVLNITLFVQNTRFSQLEWVVNKSPKSRDTNFEKIV